MDQSTTTVFFLAAILIVGVILFAIICVSKKGAKRLDVDKYRIKCLEIQNGLRQGDISSYHLSVLSADKLLDQALRELGVRGQTMGERMKSVGPRFSDSNGVWAAHKLRNRIAHEPDVSVTYEEARRALIYFRKALKDLGAI
jgi:hypothetical protein